MLGMAWGIATVVLLLAYGAGFGRAIMTVFRSFGTNLIGVFPGRTSHAGRRQQGRARRFASRSRLDHIRNEVPLVKRILPRSTSRRNVRMTRARSRSA